MHYAYRGMDADSFTKRVEQIRRVTAADVVRAARMYLQPDSLTVLAVGEKDALLSQLQGLGQVQVLPQP
jgi:predicted Zn-dependent peptidase